MEKYVVHIGIYGSRARGNSDVCNTYGVKPTEIKTLLLNAGMSISSGYLTAEDDAHIAGTQGPVLVKAFCGEVKGKNPATVHGDITASLYGLLNEKGKKQAVYGDVTIKTEWFELQPTFVFKSPNGL